MQSSDPVKQPSPPAKPSSEAPTSAVADAGTQPEDDDVVEDQDIRDVLGNEDKGSDPHSPSSQTQRNTSDSATINFDGTNDGDGGGPLPDSLQADTAMGEGVGEEADVEARISQKKDATLREFLGKMDDYAPVVRFPPCSSTSLWESFRERAVWR